MSQTRNTPVESGERRKGQQQLSGRPDYSADKIAQAHTHTHTHTHTPPWWCVKKKSHHLLLQHLASVNGSRSRRRPLALGPAAVACPIVQKRPRRSLGRPTATAAVNADGGNCVRTRRRWGRCRLAVTGETPEPQPVIAGRATRRLPPGNVAVAVAVAAGLSRRHGKHVRHVPATRRRHRRRRRSSEPGQEIGTR